MSVTDAAMDMVVTLNSRLSKAEAQRDALLAAAKAALEVFDNGIYGLAVHPARKSLKAAVAAAESNQAA